MVAGSFAVAVLVWAALVLTICALIRGAIDRRHAEWKRAVGIDIKQPAACAKVSA